MSKRDDSRTSLSVRTGEPDRALLFVFGALDWLQENSRRSVSGREIFGDLSSKGMWFCARPVQANSCTAGMPALFYLKDIGIIAQARIDAVLPVQQSDLALLSRYGLAGYFRTAFRISEPNFYASCTVSSKFSSHKSSQCTPRCAGK